VVVNLLKASLGQENVLLDREKGTVALIYNKQVYYPGLPPHPSMTDSLHDYSTLMTNLMMVEVVNDVRFFLNSKSPLF